MNWHFIYRKGRIAFEFYCSKLGGQTIRDVRLDKATAHHLGPVARLYFGEKTELAGFSDERTNSLLKEAVEFVGVYSRHFSRAPNQGGMGVEFDKSIDFRRQAPFASIDQILAGLGSSLVPVSVVDFGFSPTSHDRVFELGDQNGTLKFT